LPRRSFLKVAIKILFQKQQMVVSKHKKSPSETGEALYFVKIVYL